MNIVVSKEKISAKFAEEARKISELVAFRSKSAHSTLVPQTLTVGEATIHCSESARDLGALFDQHMTMDEQINSVCMPNGSLPSESHP